MPETLQEYGRTAGDCNTGSTVVCLGALCVCVCVRIEK